MKKPLSVLALLLVTITVDAQSFSEEIDLIQSIFGMQKKAFVATFIDVEDEKESVFWSIYDEYEAERKQLGKTRIALLEAYAENYDSMDETKTSALLNDMMALQANTDKQLTKFTKKIKKQVDVKTAAQFFQIEGYILSKIRAEILENIPLIGEN
ncbi:hypothetical protein [Algoriphagus sp. NG3]|uniref:hypothetical protein n=1 Tax=unclassified Algoriphagus TaxID=2641541 RepID=UPI002A80E537|nr:hypothetical protein [Algoriphagus sp. NG3]WPR75276.1 hypothetical protein SLW71_21675 [Algoriphagus sp. NG3]